MKHLSRTLAVTALIGASLVLAAPEDDRREHDGKLLKDAGVASAPADLLQFFRQRTINDKTRQQLTALIKQLGHDDFEMREAATQELLKVAAAAEPLLLRAMADADAEVASRSKLCIDSLKGKRVSTEVVIAAARLLVAAGVERGIETLLDYLPSASDEHLEEEISAALLPGSMVNGKLHPAIVAAAQDAVTVRRLAAAAPLARSPEHRPAARKLLDDPDARVRFFVAQALIAAHDKSAVPALIKLLGDGPPQLLWQAEDLLCRIGGDMAPQVALDPGNAASRERCRAAWDAWWQGQGDRIDLAKVPDKPRLLGLTLICDFDGGPAGQGRVYEIGADGKERWSIDGVQGAADAQVLSSGRVLIAEHNASRVSERSRDGKVVWEHRVTGNPVSCQRLANGNTFMATYTELLEVTREGKVLYSIAKPYGIYCAHKLANGHILYIHSNGQIFEVETTGREVRNVAAGNAAGWASVELLANGNFLVALYNANKVKEFDGGGKVVFEANVGLATYATRLANGHTLAADTQNRRVVEYNALGNEVWKHTTQGRPFRVKRR